MSEEAVLGWKRPSPETSRLRRALRAAAPFWIGVAVFTFGMTLVMSESVTSIGGYWQEHPFATNLVTEVVMALALVFGLDRVLTMRGRKLWRSSGLEIATEFETKGVGIDQIIDSHLLDYCDRTYGDVEIPEGKAYFEVLLEALRDPVTWAADEEIEVPSLLEWLRAEKAELEDKFRRWAPLLVADTGMEPLAAAVPPLLLLTEKIVECFEELQPEWYGKGVREDLRFGFVAAPLATHLPSYVECSRDLQSQISIYCTGRPWQPYVWSDDAAMGGA